MRCSCRGFRVRSSASRAMRSTKARLQASACSAVGDEGRGDRRKPVRAGWISKRPFPRSRNSPARPETRRSGRCGPASSGVDLLCHEFQVRGSRRTARAGPTGSGAAGGRRGGTARRIGGSRTAVPGPRRRRGPRSARLERRAWARSAAFRPSSLVRITRIDRGWPPRRSMSLDNSGPCGRLEIPSS